MTVSSFQHSLRVLSCLLVAGLNFAQIAHVDHASERVETPAAEACTAAHDDHSHTPANAPDSHDSEHCQVCHFLATGSAVIAAARTTVVTAAPAIDRRLPPITAEPHSADFNLPCSARAPPFTILAA